VPTNLLRTTAAALAAVIGGADAITVLPLDAALPTPRALGRRLARNISHLLAGESMLRRDADPAAGSYALEELTYRTATAAWAELTRLDGNLGTAIEDGTLRARWAAAGASRQKSVTDGSRVVVGVNRYLAPVTS
jgi:methylmalonyl-CoA mutase